MTARAPDPGQASAYPADLKLLTVLRYPAALWVAAFHYVNYLRPGTGLNEGLIGRGALAVDFFFILSGFILAHIYLPRYLAGGFDYRGFLLKRFARLYPIHLAVLVALVLLVFVSGRLGVPLENPERYAWGALAPNLLMVHAWGVWPDFSWNYPSWSISAEWFAYLAFPAFLAVFGAVRRLAVPALAARWLPLAGAVALFFVCSAISTAVFHKPLTANTVQCAILRIAPEFAIGLSLYHARMGERRPVPGAGWLLLAACLGLLAVAEIRLHPFVFVALSAVVIVLAAEVSRAWAARGRAMDGRVVAAGVYLGEISYVLYMIHALFGTLLFHGLARVLDGPGGPLLLVGALAAVTLASSIAHHLFDVPARAVVIALGGKLLARRKPALAADPNKT